MSAVMALTVQYPYRAGTGQNSGGLEVAPGVALLRELSYFRRRGPRTQS